MLRIRTLTLGASLIALAAATGAAAAADITVYNPPAPDIYSPAPAYSWNGPYLGAVVGYGWGTATVKGAPDPDPDGVVGGVYAGYNFQANQNFVFGLEGDILASGMKDKAGGLTVSNPWNGTLRARGGVAFDRFLVYGTGGLAVGSVKASFGSGNDDTQVRTGWTLGGGVEAAITDTVTARLEYRYTDLGSDNFGTTPKTNIDFTSSQVMLGVGMKF